MMAAGNPNWWAMFPPSFAEQPHSWSQLLLGDEEDRVLNHNYNNNPSLISSPNFVDIVKQQVSNIRDDQSLILQPASHHHTNKFLNFSSNYTTNNSDHAAPGGRGAPDYSPEESNRRSTGGACKKARVHPPSSSQPPLKVRKEKLVDRITTLHQIVSPFGKTDTASVLSEAIGYIRFLQGQIQALSYPYLQSAPKELTNSQPALLNDLCLKRKVTHNQGEEMMKQDQKPLKELRSKGLCLVPISCTQLVGEDNIINNGAAYWTPASF